MVNVVELSEQKGHAEKNIWELHGSVLNYGTISPGEITVPNIRENKTCLKYRLNDGHLEYQSSYFIGLDWLVRDKLACFVRPKMDDGLSQVDYCSMLINAIENVKNQDYLSDLVHIKFDEPFVEIEQKDDALSPFLAIQFLSLLQKIVRKGLKKSYYMVDENLNSRIKASCL